MHIRLAAHGCCCFSSSACEALSQMLLAQVPIKRNQASGTRTHTHRERVSVNLFVYFCVCACLSNRVAQGVLGSTIQNVTFCFIEVVLANFVLRCSCSFVWIACAEAFGCWDVVCSSAFCVFGVIVILLASCLVVYHMGLQFYCTHRGCKHALCTWGDAICSAS